MKNTVPHKPTSIAIFYYSGIKQDDIDTREGAKGIYESLIRLGYKVNNIPINNANWLSAVKTPADIYFNLVEDDTWELYMKVGKHLLDQGSIQLGHTANVYKTVINKSYIKRWLDKHHVPTPSYKIINKSYSVNTLASLRYPLIIKPTHQHAGIGISQHSVCTNQKELINQIDTIFTHYPGEIIVEEYIAGRELHVTVIGNGTSLKQLPICEIVFGGRFKKHWSVYTYESKWEKKTWEYNDARISSPITLSSQITTQISKHIRNAYIHLDCCDIARFDLRMDNKNNIYIIDVNMSPSINIYDEQDATTASVKALGWTYDQFMNRLIQIAWKRKRS